MIKRSSKKFIDNLLNANPSWKILDIGCGGGLISEPMARLGASVTGIDASERNIKIAKSHSEKNKLKVSDDEVRNEIQKQIKGMPGQEKMVIDYYQKNPSASQGLKGSLYEEKIA